MSRHRGRFGGFTPFPDTITQKIIKCPLCMNPMEMSVKGFVCRNSRCSNYRSSHLLPRANFPVVEKKASANSTTIIPSVPIKCCPKASFNIRTFFESMQFISSVQSRTNQYFCYEHNGISMESTGIKELTRFNAVLQQDLDIVKAMIQYNHHTLPFGAMELRDTCLRTTCRSSRINELQYLERQGKAEHNDLYWFMLTCCYILTAKGILSLKKEGHSVLFEINEPCNLIKTYDSVFSEVKYLANLNVNTAAFEMDPFYLEVRCNGYRGSIVPYIKDEIEYLAELIEPIKPKHQLNITQLMYSMDYTHRFHRLYDLLEWRNIRNDRDDKDFFERRIKSALELVAKLKGTVRPDRDGHTKVFYKR